MKATLSLSLRKKLKLLFSHKAYSPFDKLRAGKLALIFFFAGFLFLGGIGHADAANTLRWVEDTTGVVAHAYRGGSMMVQKDKISQINQIYGTSMFDGTKWNEAGVPSPRGNNVGDMFLDSRGITYIGGKKTDDGLSYIFESTDGLNWTPVQQFVDANGGGYIWNFTEDKYGNVWAGEYTSHAASTGAHLWRRSPSGVWTNVVNWNKSDGFLDDHIHNVYYDPFRDALYVAIGDQDRGILKLPSDKINSNSLSASDFQVIVPTAPNGHGTEVTAITSDASYIYAAMDTHAARPETRSLVRITDNNVDTPTMEYVYSTGEGSLGCTVWNWAHVDDNGVIIFYANGTTEFTCTSGHFVNRIVVSDDHGTTWQVVKDLGNTQSNLTGSNGSVGLPSYYATNWSGLYGFGNGWGGVPLRATIGRVLPVNQTFYVDGTAGVDWTNFGISPSRPIKTLGYLETLGIQPGDNIDFIGTNTYTNPLLSGWSGNGTSNISLRGNATSIFSGGILATTPAVAETFESATTSWNFTLNASGGSITQDSSIVHGGSYSAKVVRGVSGTTSLNLKNVATTNVQEGDTMYVSYWVYYPSDQTSSSDQNMLRIIDASGYELRMKIKPSSTKSLSNEITLDAPNGGSWTIPSRHSLSSGAWHKIYIEDYLNSTNGDFKLYVDNQLWMNVNGIKTVTAGGRLNSIYFYPYENPITFYIDDFKFGKAPLEDRGALNTNDYSYLDFGNFKLSGAIGSLISSNSSNINLHNSIFSGVTNDALVNESNSSINLFNNTIYTSGRYGLNASGNATFKNNLVYDSTSNDTLLGALATITGSNNWFNSSVKNGSGTYSDSGNTTWSGTNPTCVNSGSGNYDLLSTSSLIDSGISVDLTTDFAGSPIYGTPDIGAYEYQPPHTMGTNEIDIAAGARVYGDGKFRDLSSTSSSTAELKVTPVSESFSTYTDNEVRPEWMDITNLTWSDTQKQWTENSDTLGDTTTAHTVGDLTPNIYYNISVTDTTADDLSGDACSIIGTDFVCQSNDQGQIVFNYSGGYSEHTFTVEEGDNVGPTTTASPNGGTYITNQTVTLTCDDADGVGCDKTYYTTDNTDPTTGSTQYTTPITISATTTLKFFSTDLSGIRGVGFRFVQ